MKKTDLKKTISITLLVLFLISGSNITIGIEQKESQDDFVETRYNEYTLPKEKDFINIESTYIKNEFENENVFDQRTQRHYPNGIIHRYNEKKKTHRLNSMFSPLMASNVFLNNQNYENKGFRLDIEYNKDDYTSHDPIRITGNENFTGENGVVRGSGTNTDPYVIEGWKIDVETTAISIEDTTAYVVLTNCLVKIDNGGPFESVVFENVTHVTVTDFICDSPNNPGIGFDGCEECLIENCAVETTNGISFSHSKKITVKNCDILTNFIGVYFSVTDSMLSNITVDGGTEGFIGINVQGGHNNTITDCEVFSNDRGVNIREASDQTLRNNHIYENRNQEFTISAGGFFEHSIKYLDHDIDQSNTLNGKPIYYLVDENDVILDGSTREIGFLYLINCTNINAKNIDLGNNMMTLYNSNQCSVSNIETLSGIELSKSSGNMITKCHLNGGLWIIDAPNNKMRNNHCYSSSSSPLKTESNMFLFEVYGKTTDHYIQDIDETNTIDDKPVKFFIGENNKTIRGNKYGFISLVNCQDITIKNSVITHKAQGVLVINSSHLDFKRNIFLNNIYGLYMRWSSDITINNCKFLLHNFLSIYADYLNESKFSGCKLFANAQGFRIKHSNTITLEKCVSRMSQYDSFEFEQCNNCLIQDNNIFSSLLASNGLWFDNCDNNIIGYNKVKYCYNGIGVDLGSEENEIHHNSISHSEKSNICVYNSQRNYVHHNDVSQAGGFGEKGRGISLIVGWGNTVNYNNIHDNSIGILVAHQTCNVTNNWWGHRSGPGGYASGNGDVLDVTNATVTYDPYLKKPVRIDSIFDTINLFSPKSTGEER